MSIRGYRPHTVQDQLRFLCNAARLRVPAFTCIARMQDHSPGEQLLGTAVALTAMAEATGVNLGDLMAQAGRVMRDAEGPFTSHVQAVREYALNEIQRKPEYVNGRFGV